MTVPNDSTPPPSKTKDNELDERRTPEPDSAPAEAQASTPDPDADPDLDPTFTALLELLERQGQAVTKTWTDEGPKLRATVRGDLDDVEFGASAAGHALSRLEQLGTQVSPALEALLTRARAAGISTACGRQVATTGLDELSFPLAELGRRLEVFDWPSMAEAPALTLTTAVSALATTLRKIRTALRAQTARPTSLLLFAASLSQGRDAVDRSGSMAALQDHFLTVAKVLNTLRNLQLLRRFLAVHNEDFPGRELALPVVEHPLVRAALDDPELGDLVFEAQSTGLFRSPAIQQAAASKDLAALPNFAPIDLVCARLGPHRLSPYNVAFWRSYLDIGKEFGLDERRADLLDIKKIRAALQPSSLDRARCYRPTRPTPGPAHWASEIDLELAERRAGPTQLDRNAIFALLRQRDPGGVVWSMFRRRTEVPPGDPVQVSRDLASRAKALLDVAHQAAACHEPDPARVHILVLPELFFSAPGGAPLDEACATSLRAELCEYLADPIYSGWLVVFGTLVTSEVAADEDPPRRRVRNLAWIQQGGFVDQDLAASHAHFREGSIAHVLELLRHADQNIAGPRLIALDPSPTPSPTFELAGLHLAVELPLEHLLHQAASYVDDAGPGLDPLDLQVVLSSEFDGPSDTLELDAAAAVAEGGLLLGCDSQTGACWLWRRQQQPSDQGPNPTPLKLEPYTQRLELPGPLNSDTTLISFGPVERMSGSR